MRPYITVTGMALGLVAVWATLVHAALGTGQPSATGAPPLYADLPRHTDIARTRQTRATTSGVRQRAASANGNRLPDAQRRMA
jgi:hypothetical protein